MDNRDDLREQRLTRVDTFGQDNASDWSGNATVTARFANISRILRDLAAEKVRQLRLPVGKSTLLDALWSDFKNIARTGRAIDQDEPGFAAPYVLPGDNTERAIKLHADALLQILEDNTGPVADGGDTPEQLAAKAALRQRFIGYFMPADFVDDLRNDRDALDDKNVAKIEDNNAGNEATSQIEVLLKEGNAEVTHISAALQNLYARDTAKLHSWLAAARVQRAPKKKKPDGNPGNTTP